MSAIAPLWFLFELTCQPAGLMLISLAAVPLALALRMVKLGGAVPWIVDAGRPVRALGNPAG